MATPSRPKTAASVATRPAHWDLGAELLEGHLLRYLAELGLRPGVRITLQQRAPFRGPLHVVVGDQPQIIGHEVASLLWVEQA